jgi:hypothetical protein
MKIYQMLYKFIIIIYALFVVKNAVGLESSLENNKVGNIYIVGSSLGHNLNKDYKFIFKLEKKYNLINLSIPNISIYDQLDLLGDIPSLDPTNDKIIFLLENFYLESIFFETNYIKSLCNTNKTRCKKINLIPYKDLYLPLIEILHKRLEGYFSSKKKNIIFLVDNTNLNFSKYNLKNPKNFSKIKYFTSKYNYCVISEVDKITKLSYECIYLNNL